MTRLRSLLSPDIHVSDDRLARHQNGAAAFRGYSSYRNPHPAPPVQTTQKTIINYPQLLSVVASRELPPPQDEALTASEKSSAAIGRARAEFKNGDYLASLESTDEAISFA